MISENIQIDNYDKEHILPQYMTSDEDDHATHKDLL